jgi:hypothetical protein
MVALLGNFADRNALRMALDAQEGPDTSKPVGTVGTVGTKSGRPATARLPEHCSCSHSQSTKWEQWEHFKSFGRCPAQIGADHPSPGFCGSCKRLRVRA